MVRDRNRPANIQNAAPRNEKLSQLPTHLHFHLDKISLHLEFGSNRCNPIFSKIRPLGKWVPEKPESGSQLNASRFHSNWLLCCVNFNSINYSSDCWLPASTDMDTDTKVGSSCSEIQIYSSETLRRMTGKNVLPDLSIALHSGPR